MRADIYVEGVLAKCESLKKSGLWAPEPRLRPAAWLSNFSDEKDRVLAAVLLDNFVFYSDRASNRLLVSAYQRLEDDILLGRIQSGGDPESFLERLVFTPVEGEDPRPTDSGNPMCRKLRDLAGIADERFFQPHVAVTKANAGAPIVFVDDFLGSGNQLVETWERAYIAGPVQSFREAYGARPFPAFCLALVATNEALDHLKKDAPGITVVATHVLDDSYSVRNLAPPSLTPPIPDFHNQLRDFLARHATSLTLGELLPAGDVPLFGFHELGLLLAFEHGTPDSSVPLVWAAGPGHWIRLVKYQ